MRRAATLALALTLLAPSRPARAQESDPDPWTGPDKQKHFVVSAALAGGGYVLGVHAFDARWKALAFGGVGALAVGAGKEGLDALGFGTPSWKDFAWDAIGVAAGLGVAWLADLVIRGHGTERPALGAPWVVKF